jgi:hypothetical protein
VESCIADLRKSNKEDDRTDEHLSYEDPSGHRRFCGVPVGRPNRSGPCSEDRLRAARAHRGSWFANLCVTLGSLSPWTAQILLKRGDCVCRPESVPADDHHLGIGSRYLFTSRRVQVCGRDFRLIARQPARRRVDHLEAGRLLIPCSQLIELGVKPRGIDEHQQQIATVRTSERPGPVGTSLYDAEREMRYPSALDHPGALQLDRLGS